MVLLQQLASVPLATFGDVAEFILIKIMQHQNVYFVTDQYTPGSIKTYERERRKESGSIRISIERRDQLRPKQWSKFLKDGENKKNLIKFLFHEWSSNHEKYVKYLKSRSLFVNHGEQFHKLTVKKGIIHCQEVTKLATDQEEADTKVFLAAKHASQYSDGVCIKTVDSDIPIYALYFAHKIKAKIFVEMMCCNKRRVLDINDIREELGEELCLALPGLHAFTGNDYTSAFHGLGKKKPITMTKIHQNTRGPSLPSVTVSFWTCNIFLSSSSLFVSFMVFEIAATQTKHDIRNSVTKRKHLNPRSCHLLGMYYCVT